VKVAPREEESMAELVGVEALAAACDQVVEKVPVGLLATARVQVQAALTELVEGVGASQNPNFQQAIDRLRAMLAGIDGAGADLAAAADHARGYRAVL
jgi:hypothetical protein